MEGPDKPIGWSGHVYNSSRQPVKRKARRNATSTTLSATRADGFAFIPFGQSCSHAPQGLSKFFCTNRKKVLAWSPKRLVEEKLPPFQAAYQGGEGVSHTSGDSKPVNQRERILTATTQLMSEKGFKGTSLQEVADRVGIHKSTLFHYFKNKEELLLTILEIGISQATIDLESIFASKGLSPKKKLEKAICSHIESLAKYKDNVNIYHTEIRFLSKRNQLKYLGIRKRYASLFERLIAQVKRGDHKVFKGMDTRIVAFGVLGMCNWVVKWLRVDGPLSPEDIGKTFYRMITKH